jgi:hypothetical protein
MNWGIVKPEQIHEEIVVDVHEETVVDVQNHCKS